VTPDEVLKYQPLMVAHIPKNGDAVGNKTLLTKWLADVKKQFAVALTEADYWEVRNTLIENGTIATGRGKGGSVYLMNTVNPDTKVEIAAAVPEASLYEPFQKMLNNTWSKTNGYKDFVTEMTAAQGRRDTGGKWTRPDLVLIAVTKFPFIPGKVLDLVTFEIKPANSHGVEGVYETASHSLYAHKSYFALHVPAGTKIDGPVMERLERECKRFKVGLITFTNPEDWATFETIVEAERNNPEPSATSGFIGTQIKQENQNRILELLA
jgi:hypothetical protein